jgi:hypothetical protein
MTTPSRPCAARHQTSRYGYLARRDRVRFPCHHDLRPDLPGTQYEAAMTTKQESHKPVLSLPAPTYASIDISIAGRTEPVHEREIPVICAACGAYIRAQKISPDAR